MLDTIHKRTLFLYTPFNVAAAQLAAATPSWQNAARSPKTKSRTPVSLRQQLTNLRSKRRSRHETPTKPTPAPSASDLSGGDDLLLGDALVELAHLEAAEGLEEAGTVVGAGAVLVLEHLLGDLTVELGGGAGEVADSVE